MEFLFFFVMIILLDIVALRWGTDSREMIYNHEYGQRRWAVGAVAR